jgi:hypothetical protein
MGSSRPDFQIRGDLSEEWCSGQAGLTGRTALVMGTIVRL